MSQTLSKTYEITKSHYQHDKLPHLPYGTYQKQDQDTLHESNIRKYTGHNKYIMWSCNLLNCKIGYPKFFFS